jgi:pSer/pThr/pTyr-binding forkhead associated (FHA) protein
MPANLDQIIVRLNETIVQTVVLDGPALTIGRSSDNTLTLPHPLISRHHAEIRQEATATVIIDLGSANGVYVDGELLQAHRACPLTCGAVLQIGPYMLTYSTPTGREASMAGLDDPTIVRADLQIHIDTHHQRQQVAEITESPFFRHLREEKQRLRTHGPKAPKHDGE